MAATDLTGRTMLLTGASAGIGRATLNALVARGASVIAATRSEEKTRPLLDDLKRRYPAADLLWLPLDLADLRTVKAAAEVFIQSGRPLHVLINNAGVLGGRGFTRDGFETAIGTNHVGPFLLTELLLPKLLESSGRIVNVSSRVHVEVRSVDWKRFGSPSGGWRDRQARYALSKLFNVLHARELARRLAGKSISLCSCHPGLIASELWRELPRPIQSIMKAFMASNAEGADQLVYCATAPEVGGGQYYEHFKVAPANPLADDAALAKELYERTEQAISHALETSETMSMHS